MNNLIVKAAGFAACFVLLAGMLSPLYTITLSEETITLITIGSHYLSAAIFSVLLFTAIISICFSKYIITALTGAVSVAAVYVSSIVISSVIENLMASISTAADVIVEDIVSDFFASSIGGAIGGLAGNIVNTLASGVRESISSVALSFVESSISISWGWYVLYAAGIIILVYGIIAAVLSKKSENKELTA